MKTSIFATTSRIGMGTGGGSVSWHELKALDSVTEVIVKLDRKDIIPVQYRENPNPFITDYFALRQIGGLKVDVAVFNGNPFGKTAMSLRPTRIVVDVPAHDLERSIEEFVRLGLVYPFPHMIDPYLWDAYTEHIRIADAVVCPSKMSADYITKKLSLKNRVAVIPHGCDLPGEVKPVPEKFDVAYLGQYGPDKGVKYLIEAWGMLDFPEETLILAGTHSDSMVRYMGKGKYHLPGYVEDVSEIYNKCSVYVQPSVMEAFGMEVLEAMAHGRPVIVSEGAGASEIVEDGGEGFVVPMRDPGAIAEKISYFRDDPSEVKRMGRNARLKAERYTWDRIEKMYAGEYLGEGG